MKLGGKLIVFCVFLTFVSFLPPAFAAAVQGALVLVLVPAFLGVIVGVRSLGLLRLGDLSLTSSRGGSEVNYRTVTYGDIDVFYTMALNGGGLGLSYDVVRHVAKRFGKVGHVYEYCAGPGFIGFHLLACNLCERLTLSDVNPAAVAAIRKTIEENGLHDRVTVYQSNCLDSIPPDEKWDLIVGNPPWHVRTDDEERLILCDPGARVHNKLFRDAPAHLQPNGSILLVESHEYTALSDMQLLVDGTELRVGGYIPPPSIGTVFAAQDGFDHAPRSLVFSLMLASSLLRLYFVQLEPITRCSRTEEGALAGIPRAASVPRFYDSYDHAA